MQLFTRLAAVAAAVVTPLVLAAPFKRSDTLVPGKYIVQLRPDVDVATLTSHIAAVKDLHARNVRGRRDLSYAETGGVEKEYSFGDFHGYAGGFDDATIAALKQMPEVLNVEQDSIMTTLTFDKQPSAPWGLGSISAKNGSADSYVYDDSAGEGMYAYVVDTGIRLTHQEFGGRAVWGYNAINDVNTDNAGHGTHVAGIIGGTTYGIAKKTTLVAVKIFEGTSGTTSTVIAGFEWAYHDIVNRTRTSTSVINMSLGGLGSEIWDAAITSAWNAGVLAVVAAGNENADASERSPARSPEAICVGNVRANLTRFGGLTGSNWGPAVDIWAPGTGVESAWADADDAVMVLTGTSMAAPHVAGLVNYIRGLEGPMSAESVKERVYELATAGMVRDLKGSADRYAYNGNGR